MGLKIMGLKSVGLEITGQLRKTEAVRATTVLAFGMACISLTCIGLISGCGTPAAPQPPSLKLPQLVVDLSAERAGNTVTLHWTTPKKTTDRLLIQGLIETHICLINEAPAKPDPLPSQCQQEGVLSLAPGSAGTFQQTLEGSLITGAPRTIHYFVELKNRKGRSAGLSNEAVILAGTAPPEVTGLKAEVRADGVALHWDSIAVVSTDAGKTAIRLHRKLLTPQPKEKKSGSGGLMSTPPEAPERDLLVESPQTGQKSGAIDATAQFGMSYEYTAQRIDRLILNGHADGHTDGHADGHTIELAGAVSSPVRADVVDNFPPAVPSGLAAVFAGDEKVIDLSWQPDTEADLAGYIVYRADKDGAWERISPAQPLSGPSYRDMTVESGHTYRYAVSAIDMTGHESRHSTETTESVPNP
ncbi:fibronectin type III domain-containing protein [Acidicapsa ligni]|uniref:fibronectin type III domain-containing protein n=1 Tax=Acidicapsa ligni TaxID=542300 RepID=UPI0021DFF6DB|nr:hypothetical protein [Acidicapsa ligni]